jgi:cell surface protein SprA
MHIDLGDVSEDFFTEFGGYGVKNTEDTNGDGVLTTEEDIGLDGIKFGDPGCDLNDVANPSIDSATGDYPRINGTEGNRILDTEDLDGNGDLSSLDRYFSYSFSLTDANSPIIVDSINAWRRYRIPLTDTQYYHIVNHSGTTVQPTLKKISFARIWLDTEHEVRVKIADISIVGNKWQDFGIRNFETNLPVSAADLNAHNTSYLSGIINNQKNSSHYTPPEGTTYTEDKKESSESSLTINFNNLQKGQQCLLRQRMVDSYKLLSYEKLRFWVFPEANENTTSMQRPDYMDVILRIGADSLNYYQVRQRAKVNDYSVKMPKNHWKQLEYNLQEMIALKESNPDATEATVEAITDTLWYSFKGRPTLTNIRDIMLGVYLPSDYTDPENNDEFSGTFYFNDIRVANPYEEIGIAKRLSFSTIIADFSTLNVDYEEKSENFNPVIQRGRDNSFTRRQSLNITNKYFVNKFFPNSWALDLPLQLSRNYTMETPRFRANSDLLRENIIDPVQKDREKTERLAYSGDFGFSLKTAPKSKILQYTIFRTSLSGRVESSYNNAPNAIDTLLAYRGTANYNLTIPADKCSFKLFKNYSMGYLPSTFNNSLT